jgi:hypothetical protein
MEIGKILSEYSTRLKDFFRVKKVLVFSLEIAFILIGFAIGSGRTSSLGDETSNTLVSSVLVWSIVVPLILIAIYFIGIIFWLPPLVASRRGHAYTNIIQILTIAALFTGITWFIALIWAAFPSEKSLIDPFVGNPTGTGRRNAGDTIGSAKSGVSRGAKFEKSTDKEIDKLIDMLSKGLISEDEFKRKKNEILNRQY